MCLVDYDGSRGMLDGATVCPLSTCMSSEPALDKYSQADHIQPPVTSSLFKPPIMSSFFEGIEHR